MDKKEFVEEYQCPGCVCGSDISCFEKGDGIECGKHVCGTTISGVGQIFLGMPKGFNRVGPVENIKIQGFKKYSDGWGYDIYNVPVWKYKDSHNNIIVRGMSPRINAPFIHIFLDDCKDKINCYEIQESDLAGMD